MTNQKKVIVRGTDNTIVVDTANQSVTFRKLATVNVSFDPADRSQWIIADFTLTNSSTFVEKIKPGSVDAHIIAFDMDGNEIVNKNVKMDSVSSTRWRYDASGDGLPSADNGQIEITYHLTEIQTTENPDQKWMEPF